jgi:spore coat protein D
MQIGIEPTFSYVSRDTLLPFERRIFMMNRNWFDSFNEPVAMNWMQNNTGATQELPTETMPTQVAPAQISPTQQYVQRVVTNTVVPHYHPSHLTTINQHFINNEHYFPHTESTKNECFETNTMCGTPFTPHRCQCNQHGRSNNRAW